MNKNAIQRFAIWARTELISQVSQRAYQYDITADGYGDFKAEAVGGRLLSNDEKKQRQQLINQIRSKGYSQVMEEIAYTWFNRFIALRFMEVNNYLPTHIRVFSDASGAFKPEILTNALHLDLDGLDMEKVSDLIEKNQSEDLYRYLLLTQCNALSSALPRMFETMGSYTELLLPNNILRQDGVLGRMVSDIPEEDWTDQVQIIGWLYQYYNTELKDDTFALLKKNVKITKERIPSATQLFTPDWIVRYMVENSLGRLWIEGHPDDELKAGWKYYLDEAEQEADVQAQLEAIRAEYRTLRPQNIKVIDPCMGSGHILVYAFDVLVQIYKKAGVSERDAAQSILENNLYGLDIDDRAAQLAYFAVMMKARQYDRRIFARNIQPHVYSIVESNDVRISAKWRLGPEQSIAEKLITELTDAKEYGSILDLSLTMDELAALRRRLVEIDEMSCEGNLMDMMESAEICEGLFPLIDVAELLVQKYRAVITNPPYMGNTGMDDKLVKYIKRIYPDGKSDFFAVFVERCRIMAGKNSFYAMITQPSFLSLTSFERLRKNTIYSDTIQSLLHMGRGIFGIDFGSASFVARKTPQKDYRGRYFRLHERTFQYIEPEDIESLYLAAKDNAGFRFNFRTYDNSMPISEQILGKSGLQVPFVAKQDNFLNIPGSPIAYWLSDQVIKSFLATKLSDVSQPKSGMSTTDNTRFLRYWYEVCLGNIRFSCHDMNEVGGYAEKWYPYNKGGDYRKWYGNRNLVVNWANNGTEIRKAAEGATGGRLVNIDAAFKECLTWSSLSAGDISMRYCEGGFMFDSKGACLFSSEHLLYILGFINSVVAKQYLSMLCPTMDFNPGQVGKIPFIYSAEYDNRICKLVQDNCNISKIDWDAFETSWDFEIHPLVKKGLSRIHQHCDAISVEDCFRAWDNECKSRFNLLKKNEEELNKIFINLYGLENELIPKVTEKSISVRTADLGREIRSLVSYAVGCMFGRYSLTQCGLAYAGGEWNPGGRGCAGYGEFEPDKDNIIPICDDDYFDDDITGRFVKWVEVVFGKETLEENLKFIADALGGKGTPREVIRNYFLNDFYADHLKTYQKRPIYWLFDSGKKNGFKALIYMHRYQSDLLARMRTDYVHEQQERYRTQLKHIGDAMDSASAAERVKLAKQQKKLQEQALELQKYEEKIHHLADQNIKIDLDDGVKHNYALFEDVLAKIK